MPVPMVHVGPVRVHVRDRLVAVAVRVFASWQRVVMMVVMPVIVTMGVLVFDRLVRMLVLMRLCQMQQDPDCAKQSPENRGNAGGTLAECPSESRAKKGGRREHRSRSCRSYQSLCAQIELQARAITDGAACGERDSGARRRPSLSEAAADCE
jgi:hypothetical protein